MGQKCKLKPGDVVNRTYEAVRLLGAGYSGEVWQVRHQYLDASLALKLMHEEDRDNAHKASRFGAEASTLFHLQHEHVVRVLDANQTPEGLLFIVMELLQGETLTQKLARGRLHPLRALKYGYDLACGLAFAHENGVIHRDVKPDNVFVTGDDIVKLLDFTAAKFAFIPLRTTEPQNRVGTLAYMSPEHIEGTTADARLDEYSLGMLIYFMLRGRHAFEQHFLKQYALIRAQNKEIPEPLAAVAGLPGWIDELLAPALAKNVDQRYPTMLAFAQRIHEAGRRLEREIHEGRFSTDIPLGEPPIDFGCEPGDAKSHKSYFPPERTTRQTTGPVMPSRRVTLAPAMLPAPTDDEAFEAAATAPLASSRPSTLAQLVVTAPMQPSTAPVQSMSTTLHLQRAPRSRAWLVTLALVLALPAAGALVWRWKTRPSAPEPSAQAAPSAPPVAPATPTGPAAADPTAAVSSVASTSLPAPKPTAPRRALRAAPSADTAPAGSAAPVALHEPPAATATAIAAPPAPTTPSTAPNRMFGAED
jgi:serine/threonine-protein kinase